MRVTNSMVASKFIINMNRNAARLEKYSEQMSSGDLISRPSDDPAATAKILILNKTIQEADQYVKNLDGAKSWLDATDSAFYEINDILHRVREIAVMGANETWNDTARAAMVSELEQLKDQLVDAANIRHEGKYIFATDNITAKPFDEAAFDLNGSETSTSAARQLEIAPNITLNLNNKGKEIFINNNVFAKFDELITNISSDTTAGLVSGNIDDVENIMDEFMKERVNVGSKTHRVENSISKYEEEKLNLSDLLLKASGVDVAETMIKYKVQETAYQASLLSGNRLMNISLLDYLR